MFTSLSYFLIAYATQAASEHGFPTYPNNLNWKCSENQSYLVDVNDRTRVRGGANCSSLASIQTDGKVESLDDCVKLVKANQEDPLTPGCNGTQGEHFFYSQDEGRCGCMSL